MCSSAWAADDEEQLISDDGVSDVLTEVMCFDLDISQQARKRKPCRGILARTNDRPRHRTA